MGQVKSFLPEFKASELSLNARIEAGEDVDIENIKQDMPHIEMNFQINEMDNSANSSLDSSGSDSSCLESPTKDGPWTSDSDPDSAPSPAERDNSWTSDSDVDSSSSSSSSCRVSICFILLRVVYGHPLPP